MKIQRTDKRLVSFIGACIIVLLSTTCVCAQEIGDPLDTLKKGKAGDQRGSVEGQRDSGEVLQKWKRGLASFLKEKMKPQAQKKSETAARQAKGSGVSVGGPSKFIKRSVVYKGYSEKFVKKKELMFRGKSDEVARIYSEEDEKLGKSCDSEGKLARKIGFLGLLERGTLALARGDREDAVIRFDYAEEILNDRKKKSRAREVLGKLGMFSLGTLVGKEDIGPYWGEGYERVLMLNYKAIAYLLQGDRKAYNVTRRAIDWQNMEKKAFDEKKRKAQEKLAKTKKKDKEKSGGIIGKLNIKKILSDQFSAMDTKASTVPSAYVNPFGDYVDGMIQEFESYNDPSLRHNARISYEKALELNPKSQVLKQAVKDLKKRSCPGGTRLLHVVVGDGFVPEKKVLEFGLGSGDLVVPIKLPIYKPSPSQVRRMEVQTAGGKRLARLSPVADIEAICLRHQKDMQPFLMLRVVLAAASTFLEKKVMHEMLGGIGDTLSALHDEMRAPDTRSWMSLPATIQAARIHIPKAVKKIKIVTYDGKGKKLASKTVNLDTNTHNFVYARSLGKVLYAYPNKELWLAHK